MQQILTFTLIITKNKITRIVQMTDMYSQDNLENNSKTS